ncbi:MAG: NAD(P)H-dependent glycerol-3-phosphate dehydrogenase [Bacteroidetes bacterium]|jgi:glycerol-3-phosphate dehydrogenase (NAD(P)+)|nr:NAD(P)H-dependent glycerol-3-phosphate dehydrogenase [Bacteroidota bacterium]MBK9317634.1 NAD(P)H-dependent glycerol-3-phosphate dehydrogenase [Bacteroidota bacterium]
MQSITVVGGGSWATALVKILSNNADTIHWWLRNPETVAFINQYQHNPNYLSDVEIDLKKVIPSANLEECILQSEMILLAIPAAFLKTALSGIHPSIFKDKIVFSAIKGIVPEHNMIVGDYMHKVVDIPYEKVGVITGPCHAEEVALEKLSYLTVACHDHVISRKMASLLTCRYIRTVESDDIFGTEYAAVLKNVMAIASGICHGLGYGDNFQAVLISNAIREIKRFVDAIYPIQRDINDSAYLGDLLVTAYSQFSRNRTFGSMIGKGYSVKSAQLEMNMIAEGYYAVACIHEINKELKADLPICSAVYNILYEKISARLEMKLLTEKLS